MKVKLLDTISLIALLINRQDSRDLGLLCSKAAWTSALKVGTTCFTEILVAS
jgi:hypothetical protein